MEKKYCKDIEQLSRFAKALGHPARLAILQCLADNNGCFFGNINECLPISKATVSQHLAELKDSGLIKAESKTPKVHYCIDKENLILARKMMDCFLETCEKKCRTSFMSPL